MDHVEEQSQELDALEAIYGEELEVLCRDFPHISFSIAVGTSVDDRGGDEDCQLNCRLCVSLPADYPQVLPEMRLLDVEDWPFDDAQLADTMAALRDGGEEVLGMPMVFSIVSALQDQLAILVQLLVRRKQEVTDKVHLEKEMEERKKIEGTPVTVETFLAWKAKFDDERRLLRAKELAEEARLKEGKMTGKELFLADATLCLSDVALIGASTGDVDVDESLFQDLDDLDLDDDEDTS